MPGCPSTAKTFQAFSRETAYQKNSLSSLRGSGSSNCCTMQEEEWFVTPLQKTMQLWTKDPWNRAIQAALSALPHNKYVIMVYYGSIPISGQLRSRLNTLAEKGRCRCCGLTWVSECLCLSFFISSSKDMLAESLLLTHSSKWLRSGFSVTYNIWSHSLPVTIILVNLVVQKFQNGSYPCQQHTLPGSN